MRIFGKRVRPEAIMQITDIILAAFTFICFAIALYGLFGIDLI